MIFRNGRVSNKIEIDSDNIETPPTTRKIFPTAVDKREPTPPAQCSRRMMARPVKELPPSPEDAEPPTILGDGQFDRFSSARRTRRYKRNTDSTSTGSTVELSSPEAPAETQVCLLLVNPVKLLNQILHGLFMCIFCKKILGNCHLKLLR